MAKYTGPRCRLCRREGTRLFLKGERCLTDKCVMLKRPQPPGMHQMERRKVSDYAIRLREKQKARRIYGVLERQFRKYFREAKRIKGMTGENLLQLLERRLDNVVYRLGFASSRAQARQLVNHGHFLVNQRKVNIPSFLVKPGDVIEVRNKELLPIKEAAEASQRRGVPSWLEADLTNLRGRVISLPTREEMEAQLEESLIVEYYSR